MSTRAAIYARLSRDKTKGTDREGESLESQVKACTEWIERRGWTVGEVYRDNDVSATSGAVRTDFERMLLHAPPVVVYRHQDRLERGTGDLDRFLLAGCEGYGTDGSRATLETASGELMTRLQSIMARHEGRLKAERIQAASLRYAEAGRYRGSIRPFGQERDGTWVDAEARAILYAVPRIISGEWSFFKTAEEWNKAGLLTPATGKQGGKAWTSGTVRNFFTRPRLYGVQEYKGKLYPLADWTPLLSREEWDAIQARINTRRIGARVSPTRHDIHLLTGILKCAECGRGMNAGQRGGAGSTRLYRCPTVKHATTAALPVEDHVISTVLALLSREDAAQTEGTREKITELVNKKGQLERDHEAWVEEAVEAGLRPALIASREKVHAETVADIDLDLLRLRGDLSANLYAVTGGGALTVTKDGRRVWKITEPDYAGFRALSVEKQRDLVKAIYQSITIKRAGQGKRFSADLLHETLTSYGERLLDAYLADSETDSPIGTGPSSVKSTGGTQDSEDPWRAALEEASRKSQKE